MPLNEIRRKSEHLDECIRRRNFIGYAVGLFEVVWFSVVLFIVPNWIQRAGYFLLALGCGYLVYQVRAVQLQTRASVAKAADTGNAASIDFYRAELERQRDFHRGPRLWSRLVMLALGPLVFLGSAIADPENDRFMYIGVSALMLALLVWAVPLNLRRAGKYQREIHELDSLREQPQ